VRLCTYDVTEAGAASSRRQVEKVGRRMGRWTCEGLSVLSRVDYGDGNPVASPIKSTDGHLESVQQSDKFMSDRPALIYSSDLYQSLQELTPSGKSSPAMSRPVHPASMATLLDPVG